MISMQFLVPRPATDAAGINTESPAAVQEAKPAAAPEVFKRPKPALLKPAQVKPALQLVRPTAVQVSSNAPSNNKKNDAITNPVQIAAIKPKEIKTALLPRTQLPRLPSPLPAPPRVEGGESAAAAPVAGAPRRVFRIPTLPPDSLPSLSALFNPENFSISSLLARTLQKTSVPQPASIFPKELASFDSERLAHAAAEILDLILPSYYQVEMKKKHHALHGVVFGLSFSGGKLRTYSSQHILQNFQAHNNVSSSPPLALPSSKPNTQKTQVVLPSNSDCQTQKSIISSAVWVPTPRGDGKEEEHFKQTQAMLRRSLAEDTEIPLSFLKSLLFA